MKFEEFINDPLGLNRIDDEKKKKIQYEKYVKKKNYHRLVERGKLYGYNMEEFQEHIKDQREDIDTKMREQINKQKSAFKQQKQKTKNFLKLKTKSTILEEVFNPVNDELSDILEDDDVDLEQVGVHHIAGRVVTIDHEMIKQENEKQMLKKQRNIRRFKLPTKRVQFAKSFSR